MTTLILVALVCLIVGAAVGSLLTRTLHPQEKQRRELEEELTRTRDEHAAYQQQVTEHFARTADLVSDLAHNFTAVHEQLANSAIHLATPDVTRKLAEIAARTALKNDPRAGTTTVREVLPEPPRDYAPKAPGGVLSEDYGLEPDIASRTTTKVSALGDNQKKPDTAKEDEEDPTLKVG